MSELPMGFKVGRYYRHTTELIAHVLCEVNTTLYGTTMIAETSNSPYFISLGRDADDFANWIETTEEDWMANFIPKGCKFNRFLSCMCSRGTKSCNVDHVGQPRGATNGQG